MIIRNLHTVPRSKRFQHNARTVVLEVYGETYMISQSIAHLGAIIVASALEPITVSPCDEHMVRIRLDETKEES